MIGVEVAYPPLRQHETSSKRQSLPNIRKGFACPVWSPELPLPNHGILWKDVPSQRELGHFVPGNVPGNVAQTLILDHVNKLCFQEFPGTPPSADWGHANKFLFPGTFGIVPRNFSKTSQEQFPGIVPHELWCINLGQGQLEGSCCIF